MRICRSQPAAKLSSCETASMPHPRTACCRMKASTRSVAQASRADVGSSTISSGFPIRAATAIISRWRCPPETSLTRFRYSDLSNPNASKQANSRSSEKGMPRLAFSSKGSYTISLTHSIGKASSCGIQAICFRS